MPIKLCKLTPYKYQKYQKYKTTCVARATAAYMGPYVFNHFQYLQKIA